NALFDPFDDASFDDPMCSTLTAALAVEDRAVLAWVGDSPCWHFRGRDGSLHKRTADDHVDHPDEGTGGARVLLSQAVGMCEFHDLKRSYEVQDLEPRLARVALEPGDVLLVASDGLVDCIDEATAPERVARLEEELRRLHEHPPSLPGLVRHLI